MNDINAAQREQVAANGTSATVNPNQNAQLTFTLPSWFSGNKSTRILVKEQEQASDAVFQFQATLTDQNSQPFPPNEILIRLDANGGL
jgi:hypothetical protein